MKQPALVHTLFCCACILVLVGCASSNEDDGSVTGGAMTSAKPQAEPGGAVFANQLADGPVARIPIMGLKVWQLRVPLGAVSRSEEFWKHVDEQRVDVGTYDLLRKNGWRIGIAPTTEWPYFKDIIDAYPALSQEHQIFTAPDGGSGGMELPMKHGVPYEVISYFSDENKLFLRSFERCDNLINITLQQAPRKAGEARVTVCPTVRALRRRFEVTKRNDERVIEYVYPEKLYDLNLQVDLPINHFLVIAPSPEVKWKTSLGATFLVQDGAAEQLEQVLLLVPSAAELEEKAPTPPRVPAR